MILGVCGGKRSHEPGITLIRNGKIIFASQEKIYRNKNGISSYPHYAIKNLLKRMRINPKNIHTVAHPGITYDDMKIR